MESWGFKSNISLSFFFSQIGALQNRLRDSHVSTQDHHDILKSELARRDETIQKLRQDVLILQEKRDNAVSEVSVGNLGWLHTCIKDMFSVTFYRMLYFFV